MSRLARLLRRPAGFILVVALAVATLLAAGARPWLQGRTSDPVLGSATVVASGSATIGGLAALALTAAAAALATVTGGRIGRFLGVSALSAVTAWLGVGLVRALNDPDAVVGRVAAGQLGRTGTVAAQATVEPWTWVGAVALGLLAVGTVLGWLGYRTWPGLGRRYETADGSAGARGQRTDTQWEQLSAGQDPTVDESTGTT